MGIYYISNTNYLVTFNKCYKQILTINKNPNDISLNNIIKIISRKKLSIFDYNDNCCNVKHCMYVFMKNNNEYYTINDIGDLLNILKGYGYTINHDISKVLKNKLKENILFYIEKN